MERNVGIGTKETWVQILASPFNFYPTGRIKKLYGTWWFPQGSSRTKGHSDFSKCDSFCCFSANLFIIDSNLSYVLNTELSFLTSLPQFLYF